MSENIHLNTVSIFTSITKSNFQLLPLYLVFLQAANWCIFQNAEKNDVNLFWMRIFVLLCIIMGLFFGTACIFIVIDQIQKNYSSDIYTACMNLLMFKKYLFCIRFSVLFISW